jgi:quercetin dioxygenase-like cupin family protein
MIIQEILSQLETSSHPVAKVLQKGENFKVLAIGFKKDMMLKDHKTAHQSKLVVLNGSVKYVQNEMMVIANQYDEVLIPINEIHQVTALTDSLCLLIQS